MPIVEPTTRSWRKKIRFSSVSVRVRAQLVAPEITIVPPGRSERSEWVQVARADGLHHRVDPLGQPGPGLEHLVGADLERPRALGLVAARRQHLQTAAPGRA